MESAVAASGVVQGLVVVMLCLFLYFLPSVISFKRHVRSRVQVLILNLVLGWSLLGWFIVLVWAFSPNVDQPSAPSLRPQASEQSA
jgi:hypothetical protein